MRVAESIEIACPIETAFALVADPTQLARWQHGVVSVELDGPVAAGSGFRETREFVGKRHTTAVEITAVDPPALFALRVQAGPVAVAVRHLFEPTATGTRVTVEAEAHPTGLLRLAAGPVVAAARHEARGNLVRLKALLEAG